MMRRNSYLGLREVEQNLMMIGLWCYQLYNDGGGAELSVV